MQDAKAQHARSTIRRLTEMVVGQKGIVVSLAQDKPGMRKKLMALGILPGTPVRLLQRFPSYLIQAGRSQVVIDTELAMEIWVKT
ncbi:MAG: FeoA family protein [Bacillota bacterium]